MFLHGREYGCCLNLSNLYNRTFFVVWNLLFPQETWSAEPFTFDEFLSSSSSRSMNGWVILRVNIMPLLYFSRYLDLLHSVSNKGEKSFLFVFNVPQDHF